jgi:predicted secreted protein
MTTGTGVGAVTLVAIADAPEYTAAAAAVPATTAVAYKQRKEVGQFEQISRVVCVHIVLLKEAYHCNCGCCSRSR